MQDLEHIEQTGEQAKEYRDETVNSQQNLDLETRFEDYGVKITDDLLRKSKLAVEGRIEAVSEYTKSRIQGINQKWDFYNLNRKTTKNNQDSDSFSDVFNPAIANSAEDWVDDLVNIFGSLPDYVDAEDIGLKVDEYLTKSLAISSRDDSGTNGHLRNLLDNILQQKSGEVFHETDVFYFRKRKLIEDFIDCGLMQSGYKEKLEEFLLNGVVSGTFCCADTWCKSEKFSFTSGKYEQNQQKIYHFRPVDTRLLIHPPNDLPWCVEVVNTTWQSVLDLCLDAEGKWLDTCPYDKKIIKKIMKLVKEQGASTLKSASVDLADEEIDEDKTSEIAELADIDGNISLYEAHNIPLMIDGRVQLCLITFVNLDADATNTEIAECLNLVPIRIMPTPYIAGIPYHMCQMYLSPGEIAGRGISDLTARLQEVINDFMAGCLDMMELSVWGILVVDDEKVRSSSDLKNLEPKQIIKLKNLRGAPVDSVYKWLTPDFRSIDYILNILSYLEKLLNRTTRKGSTGEKIAPNPTATEMASIVDELKKTVNRAAMRLNGMLEKVIERMYVYYVMNSDQYLNFKAHGVRLPNKANPQSLEELEQAVINIEKQLELTPQELIIDGLEFKLSAWEAYDRQATEKQQAMQVVNMVGSLGAIGQPMTDDDGNTVIISQYKLIRKLMDLFGFTDVFESYRPSEGGMPDQLPAGQGLSGNPGTPPLQNSTKQADIARQATTMSQGINV